MDGGEHQSLGHSARKREGVHGARAVPRHRCRPGCVGVDLQGEAGRARPGAQAGLRVDAEAGWVVGDLPRPTLPQAPALTGQHLTCLPSQQMCCRVDNSKAEESGNRAHSSFPAHHRLLTTLIAAARHC